MKNIIRIIILFSSGISNAQSPNWSNDVAKIVYENCASCHRSGGIAPFRLTTYQDAVNNSGGIQYAISNGVMPPWTPDPNYKSFVHQRVMSSADKNTVLQWIANNTPSGDLRFAPPAPTFSPTSQIGTPDLTLTVPTYTVTSNNDEYRNFVLPSGLSQINFAKAIELIPGNTSIVHHILVFEDNSTNAINPTSIGGTGSSSSKLLLGYTPGSQPYFTPQGTGLKLNANTRIILQIHYAPGSMGQTDTTTINFKLTTVPQREIFVNAILNHGNMTNGPLYIPANQTRTFNQQFTIPFTASLLYVFPHMHKIGRSIESYATTNSATIPFIKIPAWDFHWQNNFIFQNVVKVNSGDIIKSVAFYDNTTNNPENPSDPPNNVSAGEGTNDEMMLVFFAYLSYQAGDENIIVDNRIIPTGATTFCDGQSVKLKTIEGIGYTYQWKKNGVSIVNATSSSYIASTAGNYTVSILLANNNSISDPITITIQPLPTATIQPTGTVDIISGNTVTLSASTGLGYTYQWLKDDILINGANSSTYTTDIPGNYKVEVNNGCYSVSIPTIVTLSLTNSNPNIDKEIIVYPNPNSGVFYVKNAENYEITVSNILGQNTYTSIINSNSQEIVITNKGIYFIKLKDSNNHIIIKKIIIE